MADISIDFMGADWDVEYSTDIDGAYIEGITINGSDELIDGGVTELFVEKIYKAFIKQLEADGLRSLEEDAGQKALEERSYNYG